MTWHIRSFEWMTDGGSFNMHIQSHVVCLYNNTSDKVDNDVPFSHVTLKYFSFAFFHCNYINFFFFVSLVERGAWNRTCEIAPSPLIGDPKLFLPKWLCNANKKLFKDPFWCNNSQFYFCCKSRMTDTAPKCHVHHPNSICMCALHITMITYWFFSCLKVFEIFHLCGKT